MWPGPKTISMIQLGIQVPVYSICAAIKTAVSFTDASGRRRVKGSARRVFTQENAKITYDD